MTKLVHGAVNYLLEQPSVTLLLGADDLGPWLYPERPEANIENSGEVMVIISVERGWGANDHNSARFPTLIVDIWADPTRNSDRSVRQYDATLKAEAVFEAIDKHLHREHNSEPGGASVFWGTMEQIEDQTAVRIISSVRADEPTYRPAIDDQGAVIATVRYNVSV